MDTIDDLNDALTVAYWNAESAVISELLHAGYSPQDMRNLVATGLLADLRPTLAAEDKPRLVVRYMIDMDAEPNFVPTGNNLEVVRHVRQGDLEFDPGRIRLATIAEIAGVEDRSPTEAEMANALLLNDLPYANDNLREALTRQQCLVPAAWHPAAPGSGDALLFAGTIYGNDAYVSVLGMQYIVEADGAEEMHGHWTRSSHWFFRDSDNVVSPLLRFVILD